MRGDYQVKLILQPMSGRNLLILTELRRQVQLQSMTGQLQPVTHRIDPNLTSHTWQKYIREQLNLFLFGYYLGTRLVGYAIMNRYGEVLEFTTRVKDTSISFVQCNNEQTQFKNAMSYIREVYIYLYNQAVTVINQDQVVVINDSNNRFVTVSAMHHIIESFNETVGKLYK